MGNLLAKYRNARTYPPSLDSGSAEDFRTREPVVERKTRAEILSEELQSAVKQKYDFSFAGMMFQAKVVDVYDGDTIRIAFHFRGKLTQWKARMLGYDSPEMRPRMTVHDRDQVKNAAAAARDTLKGRIDGKIVSVGCGKFDKFGRILITVELPGLHGTVNDWMVENNYGTPYIGDKNA
jgi:endonuclease YncB( thermonuclease family)